MRWRVKTAGWLTIEWEESGVPLIEVNPARRGFGRELIEQGLPNEIGAVTRLAFRPGGVFCEITFELGADDESGGARDLTRAAVC